MLKPLALFDGYGVELFFDELKGGSRRMPAGHVKSVEVAPVTRGKEEYCLTLKGEYQLVAVDVTEEALLKPSSWPPRSKTRNSRWRYRAGGTVACRAFEQKGYN